MADSDSMGTSLSRGWWLADDDGVDDDGAFVCIASGVNPVDDEREKALRSPRVLEDACRNSQVVPNWTFSRLDANWTFEHQLKHAVVMALNPATYWQNPASFNAYEQVGF